MPVTAHPASQRAIDTQNMPLALRGLRATFKVLRRIHRRSAVKLATRLFVQPRRHERPEWEREILAGASRWSVMHGDRRIAGLLWEPLEDADAFRGTALLVHGWEGRGTQLGRFVEPLRASGYRVLTFDHVAHGDSEGRACSLPAMRDVLRAVAAHHFGDAKEGPELVVAHSMGSFATTLLLAEGWRDTRAFYVSPPDDLLVYFSRYLELVTGSDDLLPDMIQLMEQRFGERVEDFAFRNLVETLDHELLIAHSKDDPDVPIEAGRFVAEHWRGARMIEVDGLGHRRILRDEEVVAAAAGFASEGPPASGGRTGGSSKAASPKAASPAAGALRREGSSKGPGASNGAGAGA